MGETESDFIALACITQKVSGNSTPTQARHRLVHSGYLLKQTYETQQNKFAIQITVLRETGTKKVWCTFQSQIVLETPL